MGGPARADMSPATEAVDCEPCPAVLLGFVSAQPVLALQFFKRCPAIGQRLGDEPVDVLLGRVEDLAAIAVASWFVHVDLVAFLEKPADLFESAQDAGLWRRE